MAKRKRIKVAGKDVAETIKQLISRGDVRRVCLLDEEKSLLEIPVDAGDPLSPAAALRAPVLAAIRAYSTLVNECTIEVEHSDTEKAR